MTPFKELLIDAESTILQMRRELEILRARVEMIDLFAMVLHTQPASRSQGMSPDVAWALRKEIDKIDAAEKSKPRPTIEELERILNESDETAVGTVGSRPVDTIVSG